MSALPIKITQGLLGAPESAQGGLLSPMGLAGLGLMQMGQKRLLSQAAPTGLLQTAAMWASKQNDTRKRAEAQALKAQMEQEKIRREAQQRAQLARGPWSMNVPKYQDVCCLHEVCTVARDRRNSQYP